METCSDLFERRTCRNEIKCRTGPEMFETGSDMFEAGPGMFETSSGLFESC